MNYIVARTYGNGKHMNKVLPVLFEWLSQAEKIASRLNEKDCDSAEKWIVIPVSKYIGEIWE